MDRAELTAVVRATGCAEECGGNVFLCDPKWGEAERAEATRLKAIAGDKQAEAAGGWLMIPSGGTSGTLKFARHDERTLGAAVRGFCEHFGLARVNAVNVLPAYHVSGLMARVRCAETGGEHVAWEWSRLEKGSVPSAEFWGKDWVISLVPTQLQRLLAVPAAVSWLRQFKIIFLGGGPTWPELAEAAAKEELPLSLSYGMTETAAMVAGLQPEEFLAGARSCGAALPHVCVTIERGGVVTVEGQSVFHGYWPERRDGRVFATEDLGRLDVRGHLHLMGRRDAAIITGGLKVHPAEVEAALRASGEFVDVAVVGVPDAEWGEAVVACYQATGRTPDLVQAALRLAPHQRPKRFVAIVDWPRNAQGKLNRADLARQVRGA